MSRRAHIDTKELLETARRLFLEKGYAVGTAEIARAAGISEGSIFKRFPTKAELFRAALGFPEFNEQALTGDLGDMAVQDALVTLVTRLVDFEMQVVPRIVMLISHPNEVPMLVLHQQKNNPPKRMYAAIVAYLKQESERGRLRAKNPETTARAIIGSCHSYAFFKFMDQQEAEERAVDRFAHELVETLWEGIGA